MKHGDSGAHLAHECPLLAAAKGWQSSHLSTHSWRHKRNKVQQAPDASGALLAMNSLPFSPPAAARSKRSSLTPKFGASCSRGPMGSYMPPCWTMASFCPQTLLLFGTSESRSFVPFFLFNRKQTSCCVSILARNQGRTSCLSKNTLGIDD